jgi:hypothetical protein
MSRVSFKKKCIMKKQIHKMNDTEMNQIKGGGGWVYFPGVGYTYLLDDVYVYASRMDGVIMYIAHNYDGLLKSNGWQDGSNAAKLGWWLGQLLFGGN